jgi:cytochrome c551/c552
MTMDHDEKGSDYRTAPGAAWLGTRAPVVHVVPEPGAAWLATAGYLSGTPRKGRREAPAWTEALGLQITITVVFLLIIAGGNNLLTEVSRMANAADPLTQPELADLGLPLMQASDCFTCHKLEGRLVGPSHVEIADFYSDKVNSELLHELTSKVTTGGVGVWGAVPMLPHASIPASDAELMVAWILTRSKDEAAKAAAPDTAETPEAAEAAEAADTPDAPADPGGGDDH